MATRARRLESNVDGDFWVDDSCIDCAACRWVAPLSFDALAGYSRVYHQPATEIEQHKARMALLACPTGSIGTNQKHDFLGARAGFPDRIDENVLYCGYHAASSYGATSYLILRQAGNVLVDSPRFASALCKRLDELGGVRLMFLTHRDDVADHAKFARRFGCERILHAGDMTRETREIEHVLDGTDPIRLDDEILLIPTPGHTKGSTCLLYREKFLFSGDHLFWRPAEERLVASRSVCWHDWDEQVASVARLRAFPFEWLLPGHGWRVRLTRERMADALAACVGAL